MRSFYAPLSVVIQKAKASGSFLKKRTKKLLLNLQRAGETCTGQKRRMGRA
jgi:hypothetical protein